MTPIDTERLVLEPLVRAHAREVAAALASPAIYRYIPGEPEAEEALAERFARLESRRSPDGAERWLNWAVRVRASGQVVGRVEATVRGAMATIAYLFDPAASGSGYATEACRAMIAWLAGEGVARVEAVIDTRNQRSIALALRLGMTLVEITPLADVIHGQPSDEARYALDLRP